MLSKGPQTAIAMCKYYTFKGAPTVTNAKFPALNGAANSNCNM